MLWLELKGRKFICEVPEILLSLLQISLNDFNKPMRWVLLRPVFYRVQICGTESLRDFPRVARLLNWRQGLCPRQDPTPESMGLSLRQNIPGCKGHNDTIGAGQGHSPFTMETMAGKDIEDTASQSSAPATE